VYIENPTNEFIGHRLHPAKVVGLEESKAVAQAFEFAPALQGASTKASASRLLVQATYHLLHDACGHREAWHQNDFDLPMKALAYTAQVIQFLVLLGLAMSVQFCPCTFISKR
jgi:hypothetical protein